MTVADPVKDNSIILRTEAVSKYFTLASGLFAPPKRLRAVDGVSLDIRRRSVFALVGESGCGKSTLARLIVRLLPPTEGRVLFRGEDISRLKGDGLKAFRRSVQVVFQDPFASLNPRMRIMDTLAEPYKIHRLCPKEEIRRRVEDLLRKVGLGPEMLNKYPHEFSGGQRQRICIARALTVSPEMIIADEPLSALDVSIQAQILNLLQDIRREREITLLLISHDLHVVHYLSDDVAVMYLGKIVEAAGTEDVFANPAHPYTELLLSSAPRPEVGRRREQPAAHRHLHGPDVPTPVDIPPGCSFHPRCPKRFEMCDKIVPELQVHDGRLVACHLYR